MIRTTQLATFLASNPDAIVCTLAAVRGSSPREQGTFMLVGRTDLFGTIGGGALEYMVIEHARRLIANGHAEEAMDVPLGPEIGQCCGGRVEVSLRYADAATRERLAAIVAEEEAADARTKEPGCRRFEISRSVDRPNVFSLTEAYDDLAALEAHRQTPHFLLFRQRADGGLILSKSSVCGEVIDG